MPLRRRRILVAACIVLWAAMFAVTHTPSERVPDVHVSDGVLHLLGFAALGGLVTLTQSARGVARPRRWLVALPAIVLYGAVDELTQPLANRSAELRDWAADSAGALLGVLACELLLLLLAALRRGAK